MPTVSGPGGHAMCALFISLLHSFSTEKTPSGLAGVFERDGFWEESNLVPKVCGPVLRDVPCSIVHCLGWLVIYFMTLVCFRFSVNKKTI